KWRDAAAAGFGLVGEAKTRFLIEQSDQIQHLHIAFSASSKDAVKTLYEAGIGQGYRDNGPPGLRPEYSANY
ncbi:MAG: VOC family protein, partial [Pseudomonadota bacterium]